MGRWPVVGHARIIVSSLAPLVFICVFFVATRSAVAVGRVGEFAACLHPLKDGTGVTFEGYASGQTSFVIVSRWHVVEIYERMVTTGFIGWAASFVVLARFCMVGIT